MGSRVPTLSTRLPSLKKVPRCSPGSRNRREQNPIRLLVTDSAASAWHQVVCHATIRSLSEEAKFSQRGYGEGRSDRSHGKGAGNLAQRYVSGGVGRKPASSARAHFG